MLDRELILKQASKTYESCLANIQSIISNKAESEHPSQFQFNKSELEKMTKKQIIDIITGE